MARVRRNRVFWVKFSKEGVSENFLEESNFRN